MKKSLYVMGVAAALLTAVIISNRNSIFNRTDAVAGEDTTTFSFACAGADVFFSPDQVIATIQYNAADPSGSFVTSVSVVGPVAGGTANPTVEGSGDSTTPGWAYIIFQSPQMRHIYSCQGTTVTLSDLTWRYVADNPDVFVGSAAAGTTIEGSFTEVTGPAAWGNVYLNLAKDPTRPFFTWTDGAYNLILKGSVEGAVSSGTSETMDVVFRSTPKP